MAGCPLAFGRRMLFAGAGAAAAEGLVPAACRAGEPSRHAIASVSPFGANQAGITTPRQTSALLAAFDVLAEDRDELRGLFRDLTALIAFLTEGGAAPVADPLLPPPDSGLLGPVIAPDNLTITVSVGASLFDRRYGLASRRPRHLARMTAFANDELDQSRCHGDLLLQICADTEVATIHALRAVLKAAPARLVPRWQMAGFLPPRVDAKGAATPRNLLGFKDGTANPDAGDARLMRDLVWVGGAHGEPDWAMGGSYHVVRIIRTLVERWDRTPLHEQQTIIGREKMSGAPLGRSREHDDPDYAADPSGARIPLDAHIRLANPGDAASARGRILRRPYNYAEGLSASGQLAMGLLFVCFQADLELGFLAVQGRLNGEPLEEYIRPVGGGYFFALPGVPDRSRHLADTLLAG